jgi:hypothetical protein
MRKKLKLVLANITVLGGVLLLAPSASAVKCGDQETYFNWNCTTGGNDIEKIIWAIFDIVAGLVAAGCLGAIVFGAIRYSAANSNAAAAKEGLEIIRNAVIALVLYGVFWSVVGLLTGRLGAHA